MARAIKFLQYQILAYWRRAFSIRGKYDSSSGFLLLIILGFGFKYVSLLRVAAESIAGGAAENLNLILVIVFFAWTLPVLESQSILEKTAKFLYLPISRTQFALINLAAVFLLPTSIISTVISLAAVYPLLFSKNVSIGIIILFIFVLFSVFVAVAFINLLKIKTFRRAAFLSAIILGFFLSSGKLSFILENEFSSLRLIDQNLVAGSSLGNIGLFALSACIAFLLAVFSIRQTLPGSSQTNRKLNPMLLASPKIPAKFGELVKKDFIYSWKILDCWFSLLAAIFYAFLLIAGEFSFESFSVGISFSVLMSGSLAFNIFGLENAAGVERLSLFPIKPEDLIIAKNKAFALVIFSQIFFLFPLVFFKFGAFSLAVSVLKTISIILLYTAWGNYLSIKFPYKMNFYQLTFGGSLAATMYGVLGISLLIIAPEFLTAGQMTWKLIFNILLLALNFVIYRYSLRRNSRRLPKNWENITVRLA